jgi:hypothetical protein
MMSTVRSLDGNRNARGERKTMNNEPDDPFFIKGTPIDTRGAWRRVFERETDRIYSKLQADWDES